MRLSKYLIAFLILCAGWPAMAAEEATAPPAEKKFAVPPGQLISDLTCALPAGAWTEADSNVHKPISKPPPGLWRIIDYTSELYKGRALMTTRPDSATITIPLNRQGWHAIALGISERQYEQAAIEVRLTGDTHWQLFRSMVGTGWGGPLCEEPWLMADLTGTSLEIRFPQNC